MILPLQTRSRNGFTLMEMLTATAILLLLVALLAGTFSSLTATTSNSSGKLEVDVLARQALDRIGRDLALMPMRKDLDYFLNKQDGNDEFSFFSSVPGVLPSAGGTSDAASGVSLVSYRVANGKLERMSAAQSFASLTFLTYDTAGALVPNTGITRALSTVTDTDYHIFCEGVFRCELGFLLKDGSYTPLPMDTGKNPTNPASPGVRRWTTSASHNFAEISVPDGPSSTVFRPLGWQDVAAVVVTLALIDPVNKAKATLPGIESVANELSDAVASTNPAALISVWKNTLETPGSPAIPETTRNAIRIYQRIFYLNSPQS